MTRRKLTAWIVAGALAAAGISIVLLKKNETPVSLTPAASAQDGDAERPADTSATQIEQVPRRSEDVFMPPSTNATGMSPPPPPPPK